MFAFLVRKILFSIFLQILTGFTQVYKNNELKKKNEKLKLLAKRGVERRTLNYLTLGRYVPPNKISQRA